MSTKIHATLEIYKVRNSKRLQWRLLANNGDNMCRGSTFRGWTRPIDLWKNVRRSALYLAGVDSTLLPDKCPKIGQTIDVENAHVRLTIRRIG